MTINLFSTQRVGGNFSEQLRENDWHILFHFDPYRREIDCRQQKSRPSFNSDEARQLPQVEEVLAKMRQELMGE